MSQVDLVKELQQLLILRTPAIIEAFKTIDRRHFLPETEQTLAYWDKPISIGYGQTNSQPRTVAFMLELLAPQEGQKILDVGSGSGWTTAMLAHIVGPKGFVYARERIDALVKFAQMNLTNYSLNNIDMQVATTLGAPEAGPFDRILVSAAAREIPQALVEQLKPGGIMVIPIEDSVCAVRKNLAGDISVDSHFGYTFVPLITNNKRESIP